MSHDGKNEEEVTTIAAPRRLKKGLPKTVMNESNNIINDSTKEYLTSIGARRYISKKILILLESYMKYEEYFKSFEFLPIKTVEINQNIHEFKRHEFPNYVKSLFESERKSIRLTFDDSLINPKEKPPVLYTRLDFSDFETSKDKSQCVAFCGGSIHCLSASLIDDSTTNFIGIIACSVSNSFDLPIKFGKSSLEEGNKFVSFIQLWSFLLFKPLNEEIDIKFKFICLIHHDLEFCRMLKFHKNELSFGSNKNLQNEMLLCTSSKDPLCKIFIIPHSLILINQNNKYLKLNKSIDLITYKYCGFSTCVAWCYVKKYKTMVAAGFFSGAVCIWDIDTIDYSKIYNDHTDPLQLMPIRILHTYDCPMICVEFFASQYPYLIVSNFSKCPFLVDFETNKPIAWLDDGFHRLMETSISLITKPIFYPLYNIVSQCTTDSIISRIILQKDTDPIHGSFVNHKEFRCVASLNDIAVSEKHSILLTCSAEGRIFSHTFFPIVDQKFKIIKKSIKDTQPMAIIDMFDLTLEKIINDSQSELDFIQLHYKNKKDNAINESTIYDKISLIFKNNSDMNILNSKASTPKAKKNKVDEICGLNSHYHHTRYDFMNFSSLNSIDFLSSNDYMISISGGQAGLLWAIRIAKDAYFTKNFMNKFTN